MEENFLNVAAELRLGWRSVPEDAGKGAQYLTLPVCSEHSVHEEKEVELKLSDDRRLGTEHVSQPSRKLVDRDR